MKLKQKRKQTLIAAAVLLGVIFTGCSAPQSATGSPSAAAVEELTLFDTDTLEITLEGAQTRIENMTPEEAENYFCRDKRKDKKKMFDIDVTGMAEEIRSGDGWNDTELLRDFCEAANIEDEFDLAHDAAAVESVVYDAADELGIELD